MMKFRKDSTFVNRVFWQALLCVIAVVVSSATVAGLVVPAGYEENVVYYHNDALGSPIAATDKSGDLLWKEEYRPFGKQLLKENDENDRWYTGKQHEEDFGLSYFGARWYNPEVGRFVSIDPAGVVPTNLHSYNRYAYGNNNPYKYVDPDGNNPKLVVDFALNVGINYLTTGQLGLASAAVETVKGALNPLATLNKIATLSKLAVSIRKANAGMAAAGPVTKSALPKHTKHSLNQKINRQVKTSDELDAIRNPLDKGSVKYDSLGRPSQRSVGKKAEVVVNPDTNKVVSVNPTSSKKAARLGRRNERNQ